MLTFIILNLLTFGLWSKFNQSGALVGFQEIGSLVFDHIVDFHDYIIIYLVFIFVVVLWCLGWALSYYPFKDQVHFYYALLLSLQFFFINQYRKVHFRAYKDTTGGTRVIAVSSPHTTQSEQSEFRIIFSDVSFVLEFLLDRIKNPSLLALNWFLAAFTFSRRLGFALSSLPKFFFDFSSRPEMMAYLGGTYHRVTTESDSFLRTFIHGTSLEIVWTILPSFILLAIAIPSLILLYELDAVEPISLGIKVIGHQWYWSYEIGGSIPLLSLFETVTSFDSYMISDELSNLRLLEVDNPLFVPAGTPLTFLVTSTDVLHSWALPSLGIKMDAIPGRINQVAVTIIDVGSYFGQCSELCGVNHGFMPINVISYAQQR